MALSDDYPLTEASAAIQRSVKLLIEARETYGQLQEIVQDHEAPLDLRVLAGHRMRSLGEVIQRLENTITQMCRAIEHFVDEACSIQLKAWIRTLDDDLRTLGREENRKE